MAWSLSTGIPSPFEQDIVLLTPRACSCHSPVPPSERRPNSWMQIASHSLWQASHSQVRTSLRYSQWGAQATSIGMASSATTGSRCEAHNGELDIGIQKQQMQGPVLILHDFARVKDKAVCLRRGRVEAQNSGLESRGWLQRRLLQPRHRNWLHEGRRKRRNRYQNQRGLAQYEGDRRWRRWWMK